MKNMVKLFGVIALVAVIGFTMAACGDGGGGGGGGGVSQPSKPTSAKYKSTDTDGNTYVLEITKAGSRAAYQPQSGDNYTLTITLVSDGETEVNKGTVTVAENVLTLSGGTSLTVTISAENEMVAMTGTIPRDDGSSLSVPATLTSKPASRTQNLYLTRWGDTEEAWQSLILLSEVTPLIPKQGDKFTFKASGTTNKALKSFGLSIDCLLDIVADWDQKFKWIGASGGIDLSGTFEQSFEVTCENDPISDSEIRLNFISNKVKPQTNKPSGIMATISNFDVTLVKFEPAP